MAEPKGAMIFTILVFVYWKISNHYSTKFESSM